MAYRKVYLRIRCNGYDPFSTHNTDLTAFKEESRRLFQDLGWTLQEGRLVAADTAHGVGIRAATAKEIRLCSQPAEQVNGQITMTF